MYLRTSLSELLKIDFPVIMAPMFLVSNVPMIKAAIDSGIAGAFPTLNFRKEGELEEVLKKLNEYRTEKHKGTYGVNLIVQRSNLMLDKHLKACVDAKVPFYITSLGKPDRVIEEAKSYGAKVFCDVINVDQARICANLGCDGFIAVGQGAGGHAGPNALQVLLPALRKEYPTIPVVAAGGVATGQGLVSMLALGATGVSVGTRFIASEEASVNDQYKQGIINAHMDDIVMTERLSGTPSTIINTPYAKRIGYKQNWLERMLSNNKRTKKYFKMLVQVKGMKRLEKAIRPGTYQDLWIAGQSVEMIDSVMSVEAIVKKLKQETEECFSGLSKFIG